MLLPWSFLILLFVVSAAQNMTTSLLTLLFATTLQPQQATAFWLFMSWVYWFSPVSGWISDVCGSRKVMLLLGLVLNIGTWYAITFAAFDFTSFVVVGLCQNASMLFVNSAVNGALVEVARERDAVAGVSETNSDSAASLLGAAADPLLTVNEDAGAPDDASDQQPAAVAETVAAHGEAEGEQQQQQPQQQEQPAPAILNRGGATQSEAMMARSLGSVLGAVVQTFALVYLDIRPALAVGSAMFGLAAVVAMFAQMQGADAAAKQDGAAERDSLCGRIQGLFTRLRQLCDAKRGHGQRSAATDVVLLLVFVFCNNMLPDATSFYYQYVFDGFAFPNWFNSCFQLSNLVGALAACEAYRRWLAPLSQVRVFFAGCLAAALSYLTSIAFATGFTRNTLHVPDAAYLIVDAFVVGFLNRVAFLPVLHVAACRCPRGFEAVVFELFSLAAMGGATVAALSAIRIADALAISKSNWEHLWILMVIAALSRLLPLVVVPYLPAPVTSSEAQALQQPAVSDVAFGSRSAEEAEAEPASASSS